MLAVLLFAVGLVAVAGGRQFAADRSFHPIKVPAATPAPVDAASALNALTASSSPIPSATASAPPSPTAAGVAGVLAGPLRNSALGSAVAAQVIDAATGTTLFARRATELVAPASTSKLLTAAAILTVHKPTDQFVTTVVQGADPSTVVLVGGGDPTLSGAAAGQAAEYDGAARISDLAAAVRKSVGSTPISHVVVDNSLFSGPLTAPGWAAADAPSSYASPITAIMVDAGRDTPDSDLRSGTPDLAAGRALAAALQGADVTRGRAPVGAKVLGQVRSAQVGRLVEQMLNDSDNVIAEVLTRQVAIADKQPASFAGGASAVSQTLARLGITVGSGMKDGSGLSSLDRVPANALAAVLVKATSPTAGSLHPIVAGLSVAGWGGTLTEQDRFTGPNSRADGLVRAKTGSLSDNGVSSLTGLVTDKDGRQLVFNFVADQAGTDPTPVRDALDALATALVSCGCRT